MKKQNGITLIALIITIIVLLILAGVSISIIVGDNGVIKQTQTAKDKIDLANAQNAIETAVATLQTEYMALLGENSNFDIAEIFTYKKINDELSKLGYQILDYNDSKANDLIFGEGSVAGTSFKTQIKSKKSGDNNLYHAMINKSSKSSVTIGKLILAEKETSSKIFLPIGERYNYSVTVGSETISDWKIFWKDDGGTYIITTDYLNVEVLGNKNVEGTIANKAGLTTYGKYGVGWVNSFDVPDQINFIDSTFLLKYHRYSLNTDNLNSRAVSSLLNTNNWSDFATGTGASWAIGSPTLEMYIASWNEKTKNDVKSTILSCNLSGTGYQMKIDSANFTLSNENDNNYDNYLTSANMSFTTEYSLASTIYASLYYPYTTEIDFGNCVGYRLASPSAYGENDICGVSNEGSVDLNGYKKTTRGLRPVVYIQ